ncbi:glycosyltransferase family 2 protein [Chloroflexota bacterium]
MSQPKILIVLPAFNEEATIGKVIDEIPKSDLEQAGYKVEVLVVDNNSTDRTRRIAYQKGATIIVELRKGKGRAVITALNSVNADFIFMLDTDYTYPANRIPDMLKLLNHHHAVIGSRIKGQREKHAMSWLNLIGNRFLSLLASMLYQRRVSDVCSGYWGFKAEVIEKLRLRAVGFELEAELFSQLARRGYSIAELPILYRRRVNRPKLSPLRDGFRIGRVLIAKRFSKLTD